jgi:hypothetical protein
MVASVTEQPFKALSSAIESKDRTAFAKSYADLTLTHAIRATKL